MANCGAGAGGAGDAGDVGDGQRMRRRIAMSLQRSAETIGLGMQRCVAKEERELEKAGVPVPKEFQDKAFIRSRQQVRDKGGCNSGYNSGCNSGSNLRCNLGFN